MSRHLGNTILNIEPGFFLFQDFANSSPFNTEALSDLFLLLMKMILLIETNIFPQGISKLGFLWFRSS